MSVLSHIRPAVVSLGLFTVLCGGLYPLAVTATLQSGFKSQAEGSLIRSAKGEILGSRLIGQNFSQPKYLWGRLSATATTPYNAGASSGSNYGVNNPALHDAIKVRIEALRAADPTVTGPVPVDLVTASASGLDPEISPAAAAYQVGRIAKARGMTEDSVRNAISLSTYGRDFGILGEARVNVLEVNLRLDGQLK